MHVWLTDWQVAEEQLLIRVGDSVNWTLFPAARSWLSRLFGERVVIDWQFDTYGGAVDQPALQVLGEVVEIRSVWCPQTQTDDGFVPVNGGATLHPAVDTSGSWTNIAGQCEADRLYGYVLSLAISDEEFGAEEVGGPRVPVRRSAGALPFGCQGPRRRADSQRGSPQPRGQHPRSDGPGRPAAVQRPGNGGRV